MTDKLSTSKAERPVRKNERPETLEQLITFSEVGKALASSFEIKEILSIVMEKIHLHFHPGDWSLLLIDEETNELKYELAIGNDAGKLKELRLKPGEGIAGWVAKDGFPLLVNDLSADKRFSKYFDTHYNFVTGPVICVPLKTRGKTLGVIELYNVGKERFSNDADMLFLSTLADYTAIAIENSILFTKVEDLTVTDELTDLYNSRFFNQALDYEVEKATRYNYCLSMIFMDMDYFKTINDNHGHLCGSTLLKEVGEIIKVSIRNIDFACRYGGDEFVILMPETPKNMAQMVAERVRNKINENIFLKEQGVNCHVTASFGVATFPDDASTRTELIDLTDKAMYSIKNTTRNGIAVHTG